jgi:hypothetical protein
MKFSGLQENLLLKNKFLLNSTQKFGSYLIGNTTIIKLLMLFRNKTRVLCWENHRNTKIYSVSRMQSSNVLMEANDTHRISGF